MEFRAEEARQGKHERPRTIGLMLLARTQFSWPFVCKVPSRALQAPSRRAWKAVAELTAGVRHLLRCSAALLVGCFKTSHKHPCIPPIGPDHVTMSRLPHDIGTTVPCAPYHADSLWKKASMPKYATQEVGVFH